MSTRTVFGVIIMLLVFAQAGYAGAKNEIQKYFNDTALKVETTDDPTEKREILNESLQNMTSALEKVRSMPFISKEDQNGIDYLNELLQEKHNELTGSNGFTRVPDAQLNAFSVYVVQSMEQASRTVTLSLTTLLLIIIIVILLA